MGVARLRREAGVCLAAALWLYVLGQKITDLSEALWPKDAAAFYNQNASSGH
jgi:hypothetical protein